MSLIRISESDDFFVDYDRDRGMYRVSVFENNHFKDEYWFDCYEEKELKKTPEEIIKLYWETFMGGAAHFMKYMHDYYGGDIPIYPSEMEDILVEFAKQYGEVKNIDT